MKRSNLKKIDIRQLVIDRKVNFRDDYDVPSMKEEIVQAGRILEPLHVREEDYVILKGNRRGAAGQELAADPKCPADLLDALTKVDVFFYSDLTERELTELVLDHGSQKSLTRVEILKATWRLQKMMYSERDIITLLYHQLARYTGKTRKAYEAQQIAAGPEREKFLTKWLHGTVGNYMLPGGVMGNFIREQFVLTDLVQDRALTAEEEAQWTMSVTRDRISELVTAKKTDKDGNGWSPDNGGEAFNAKIAEYVEEDKNPATKKKTAFTSKQMETTADAMQSGFRYAFQKCAGTLPEKDNAMLEALDTEYFRRDQIFSVLNTETDRVTDAKVQAILRAILVGTKDDVKNAIFPFCS